MDRDELLAANKSNRLPPAEPIDQAPIGLDEPVVADKEDRGAQSRQHLVHAVGLGGDRRIEATERSGHLGLDEHRVEGSVEARAGQEVPADVWPCQPLDEGILDGHLLDRVHWPSKASYPSGISWAPVSKASNTRVLASTDASAAALAAFARDDAESRRDATSA